MAEIGRPSVQKQTMQGLHVNVDVEKIDMSMDKVLKDYPDSILPKKFNKRNGKAKTTLFEAIDDNLYEEEALIATFHTSLDRIKPWIITLDIFYRDHDNFDIKWKNVPSNWSDPSDDSRPKSNLSIVIDNVFDKHPHGAGDVTLVNEFTPVREEEEHQVLLRYNVTFFVTTGTIRVQGPDYLLFVKDHFPKLMIILNAVLNRLSDDGNQNTANLTAVPTIDTPTVEPEIQHLTAAMTTLTTKLDQAQD